MLIKANGAIKSTRPVLSQSATVHYSHITHWSRGHMRSHDQLKTKYPLLCKAYGHKTWQICSFWWGKLTHGQPGEVMWQIKRFISPIPQTLWPPNLTGGATCERVISPIMSHDRLVPRLCEVTWQIESLISPLPKGLWPSKFAWYSLITSETPP